MTHCYLKDQLRQFVFLCDRVFSMAKPFLGVRIPEELNSALLSHIRETGQTKSDIVIAALQAYLGLMPCHRRLDAIERRLSEVEATMGHGQSCVLPDYDVVHPVSGMN